jgi:hypothetical protein
MTYFFPKDITLIDSNSTNASRMLDSYLNTKALAQNELIYSFDIYKDNILGFFRVEARDVKVEIFQDNTLVRTITQDLRKSTITNIWEYMKNDVEYKQDFIIKLPFFIKARIKVTLSNTNKEAKIGKMTSGIIQNLGMTLYSKKIEILDYSKIEKDEEQNITGIIKGDFAKKIGFDVIFDTQKLDSIVWSLEKLRAQHAVFVIDETKETMVCFGMLKYSDILISNPVKTIMNLEVEGIV